MKVLDLFAGLGGFSAAFKERGHEVIRLELLKKFNPEICIDIQQFHTNDYYDVVLASPPCIEFSVLTQLSYAKGQRGPLDPEKGMILVREAKRVIDEIKPQFWVLENVRGSQKHISAFLGSPRFINGAWILWGNFPELFMTDCHPLRKGINVDGPLFHGKPTKHSSASRSLVHPYISKTLCIKIEQELLNSPNIIQ
jgi:hypothetical protein